MKYIVYVINYPTLCRALRYIDTQWGKENSIIMYASSISHLPVGIQRDYNTITVPYNVSPISFLRRFSVPFSLAHNSWKLFKKLMSSSAEECTLVVFRDNMPEEATLIERAFRRYPERLHLWVIEEGVGLYKKGRSPLKAVSLRRIIYVLCGISLYALKDVSHGEDPKVEKIICQHPELVKDKFLGKHIEKQIDIFIPEFNKRFASYILEGVGHTSCEYDYVFLTTPIFDYGDFSEAFIERYHKFLYEFFSVVSAHGKLLVKKHPRDKYDYSKFTDSKNISFCSAEENTIPFECLYDFYGQPQILSFGSSVSLSITCPKPTILINDILGLSGAFASIVGSHKECPIIVCRTMDDLKIALTNN